MVAVGCDQYVRNGIKVTDGFAVKAVIGVERGMLVVVVVDVIPCGDRPNILSFQSGSRAGSKID